MSEIRVETTEASHALSLVAARDGMPIGRAKIGGRHHNHLELDIPEDDSPLVAAQELAQAALNATQLATLHLWVEEDQLDLARYLTKRPTPDRTIIRMECDIRDPSYSHLIDETRPFTRDDLDEVVRINNEAFATHPDRSQMTVDEIKTEIESLGNNLPDLRILESNQHKPIGFCWIKRHSPPNGELYVIAVDNGNRGRALGRTLLESGLTHLRSWPTVTTAFLYVEDTNTHAINVYEKFGFRDARSSRYSFLITAESISDMSL